MLVAVAPLACLLLVEAPAYGLAPAFAPLRTAAPLLLAKAPPPEPEEPPPEPSAPSFPALPSERHIRTDLRHQALEGLRQLEAPAAAALARERAALVADRSQRRLIVPVILAVLSPLFGRRWRSPMAVAGVFLASRLCSASITQCPDPRVLVPPSRARSAALHASTLALESSGLACLSLVLASSAACASIELGVRSLCSRAASADGVTADVMADPLSFVRLDAVGASLQKLGPPSAWVQPIIDTSPRLWNATRGAVKSFGERVSTARATRLVASTDAPDAELAGRTDTIAPPSEAVGATATPASADTHAAASTAASSSASVAVTGGGDAHGTEPHASERDAAPTSEAEVGAAAASPSRLDLASSAVVSLPKTHLELRQLALGGAKQAAVHAALSAAAAAWAAEAAFLVLLALAQRARLLAIAAYASVRERAARGVPAAQSWFANLPRSTEDVTSSMNYQLNLIGLQTEQWMTDSWAGYLRQRRKWLSGSSGDKSKKGGKGRSKGAKGGGDSAGWSRAVGSWWDELVVSNNQRWGRFQLDSAKRKSKKQKQPKLAGAAPAPPPRAARATAAEPQPTDTEHRPSRPSLELVVGGRRRAEKAKQAEELQATHEAVDDAGGEQQTRWWSRTPFWARGASAEAEGEAAVAGDSEVDA